MARIEERRSRYGFVYFLHCADTDTIKIGSSQDVKGRIKALQAASPGVLDLVASWKCGGVYDGTGYETYQAVEFALHRFFSAYRKHGEWFEAKPVLDTLPALMADKKASQRFLLNHFGAPVWEQTLALDLPPPKEYDAYKRKAVEEAGLSVIR